jgi:hypothetical protein
MLEVGRQPEGGGGMTTTRTSTMNTLERWQDEYLDLMARWEEPVVTFTGKAADSVAKYVPERPGWAFLAELPTITEVVESQLKFRRRVVDEQAAFARRMMRAMQPALMRLEPTATTTPAAKARATKARATKARATKARSTGPRAVKAVGIRAA